MSGRIFDNNLHVALLSSYPPRQCGIATFSCDLIDGMKKYYNGKWKDNKTIQVISIEHEEPENIYPEEVIYTITDQNISDFSRAAEVLNDSPADIVSLQHEFNLYGGEEGSYIIRFINELQKPVVSTLHTIYFEPPEKKKEILQEVCSLSDSVVVMSDKASAMLKEIYGIPEKKITKIHHGIHDVPFAEPSVYKKKFSFEGKKIILTFGFLDQNKGVDYAIEAMEDVVAEFPETIFIVLGRTHPVILKKHGESYRESLIKKVAEKGLHENVIFYNSFVSLPELLEYMLAADIFITPYPGRERICSGVLAYALGCGKATVSTPYCYAEEMLENERGCLVPFGNSKAISRELIKLLRDDELRNKIRKNAYNYSRQMVWDNVAETYLKHFQEIVNT